MWFLSVSLPSVVIFPLLRLSLHRPDREPYGSGGTTRAEASASLVVSPWFYGLIIPDVRRRSW